MAKFRNLLVALGVVAGLGVAAIPLSSYAVEGEEDETTTPAQTVSAFGEVTVEIGGSISIYVADVQGNYIDHIDLGEIMNNSVQVDNYGRSTMVPIVTTNATTGYNLAMSFGYSGFGGGAGGEECDEACVEKIQQRQQNLANNNSLRTTYSFDENDAAIPAVGANGKIQPGVSAWGYKLTEIRTSTDEYGTRTSYNDKTASSCTEYTCWSAMPASNQAITIDSRNPSDVRDYQLGVRFGVSANGTQAEGRYTGGVIFIATAR